MAIYKRVTVGLKRFYLLYLLLHNRFESFIQNNLSTFKKFCKFYYFVYHYIAKDMSLYLKLLEISMKSWYLSTAVVGNNRILNFFPLLDYLRASNQFSFRYSIFYFSTFRALKPTAVIESDK